MKERGYKIGIIRYSYAIAAGFVADRLSLDFVMANKLHIFNGKITGKVDMPLGWNRILAVIVKFLSASHITWKKCQPLMCPNRKHTGYW